LAWLVRKETPEKALAYSKKAVDLAPDAYVFKDTLGKILMEQGDNAQAIAEFEAATRMAPENLDIRYHLAQALASNGDKSGARNILVQILRTEMPFQNRQDAQSLHDALK